MLTFSQRRSSSVALSSPASVLLRGGVTLQGLQPCAGHVFNRKLGGRGTGLRVHRSDGASDNKENKLVQVTCLSLIK